jgi:hypothetical protein
MPEDFGLHAFGQPKHVDGAVHAGLGGLHGVMLIVNRRGRTGEIVNFVDLDIERESHVVPHQLEARMIAQMGDVQFGSGEEIVDAKDVVALGDQSVAQMGTQETRATGDQNSFHVASSRIKARTPTAVGDIRQPLTQDNFCAKTLIILPALALPGRCRRA